MQKRKQKKTDATHPSNQSGNLSMDRWNWVFGVFGLVIGLASFVLSFIEKAWLQERELWVRGAGVAIVTVTLLFLVRRKVFQAVGWVHTGLNRSIPWLAGFGFLLIISILTLTILIFLAVKPSSKPVPIAVDSSVSITFDRAKGAIFNSWQNQYPQKRHIIATGEQGKLIWEIDEHGAASFSYKVNVSMQPSDSNISSGGYMTFYGRPFDRLAYRAISFTCKATGTNGRADLGIRLAVDEPLAQGDRERVTYELPSLKPYNKASSPLNESWQTFTIDISEFKQKRFEPPLPDGIEENSINKIVFFVTKDIVKNCPKATLWFRDVTLIK